jgi:hypothetical protein
MLLLEGLIWLVLDDLMNLSRWVVGICTSQIQIVLNLSVKNKYGAALWAAFFA